MSELIKHLDDIGYSIKAEVGKYHVDFKAFRIVGESRGGAGEKEWVWESDCQPVHSLEKADVFLSGSVKWDGCSNWKFDEQEKTHLHFCNRESMVNVGLVLAACFDWAKEILPTFDNN